MQNYRKLFPLGKASGAAFCNRLAETKQLIGNIESGKHTLLIAPRRYGKSSLAERAIQKSGINFVGVNFHLCTSEQEVADLIINKVIQLIGQVIGPAEKIIHLVKRYLSHLEPLISFGGQVAHLQLIPKKTSNPALIIAEGLQLLEKLLRDKQKRAVLFFDEFQEINKICEGSSIEGAIRTAVQEMEQGVVIFSGSMRSLLLSMFENENRPLYKLCRKIQLKRILNKDYESHIQKISQKTWAENLPDSVFESIMKMTNRHPYYVNYLCDVLWETCETLPTDKEVEQGWHKVVIEERSDALKEISDLSLGQRRVLKYIANVVRTGSEKGITMSLQSQDVCMVLGMVPSTISTATQALIQKDYIEKGSDHYFEVINPVLATVLRGEELSG